MLLHEFFGALLFEQGVIAAVAGELAAVEMHGDAAHRVEKFAVVRNDQQQTGIARQPLLQPDQGVEIEVIGRLVEQQAVAGREKRLRQGQPHAPAAGETVDRVGQFSGFEAQPQNQRLGARRCVVGTGILQRHVGVRHAVIVVGGLGGADFLLCRQQGDVAINDEIGGRLIRLRHVLRHLAHAPVRRNEVFAAVLVQVAVEQGEQRGLASAIAPDQTDFFARIKGHAGGVKQHFGTAAQSQIFK
ncbi:hypothetical protein GALL_440340 [mine drainage metagenome]|uniref:Uncharacterized protein n=1 Tax=mine drainage metagenome TaxID=410659 RepID=A0A1J5PRT4_9ZZZZ